ncbi:MAG: hypothetical protein AABZ15_06660 [Nitrospirota bacterium]
MTVFITFFLAIVIALPAYGHPGKTDRDGGHKCYKECAEWDLYYAEYHLHDKDGRAVKVARKKPVRPKPDAAPAEDKPVRSTDGPADAPPSQPAAVAAAAAGEPDILSLPWILIMVFLILLLIVKRRRRKASDAKQAAISK